MKHLAALLCCAVVAAALVGCVMENRGPPPNNAYWVKGYNGPNGDWHAGHWQERQ